MQYYAPQQVFKRLNIDNNYLSFKSQRRVNSVLLQCICHMSVITKLFVLCFCQYLATSVISISMLNVRISSHMIKCYGG